MRVRRWLCRLGLHYPRTTIRDTYLVLTWRCDRCGHVGMSAQFEGW